MVSPLCYSRPISVSGKVTVSLQSDGCRGTPNEVNYLEHVQAVVTLSAARRGLVTIYLTSPLGTRSTLLLKRDRDASPDGFTNWAFMTTHSWGEVAAGQWKLEIDNEGTTCKSCYNSLNTAAQRPLHSILTDIYSLQASPRSAPIKINV